MPNNPVVQPLPALSEKLNEVRILSILLKDAINSLPKEERDSLVQAGYKQKFLMGLPWILFKFVGFCHKVARNEEKKGTS